MPLTLRVVSTHNQPLGSKGVKVFTASGSIGRTPENTWVLPDPERFVSSLHARISHEGGRYFLVDESTNGTVVNGQALGKGVRVELHSGDRITIGKYEISVALESASVGTGLGGGGSLKDLFPGDSAESLPPTPPAPSPRARNVSYEHVPAENRAFVPPRTYREEPPAPPPPSPPRGASGAPELPPENEQWWLQNPPGAAPPPESAPMPELLPENDLPPENEQWWLPDAKPAPPKPSPPPPPSPRRAEAPPRPVPERRAPEPPAEAGEAPSARGATSGDLAALLEGMGLDPATVDPEAVKSLGEVFRVIVEGMLGVLKARAEVKNQFRVAMTTLKPLANNPLKFSATADDALFNMFARRGGSFLSPIESFREAFDDLRSHQLAMLAGMRAAFVDLMRQFDPEALQENFDRGMKRAALFDVMNKTKYWDLYRELYASFGDDDETFKRLFGDEFARAYDEQLRRLTAPPGKR